jgi:ribonuclease Z
MARLVFVGTSAALPTADRANTVLALQPDTPGQGLLIDCGGDVYGALLRVGIGPNDLSDVFITHAHIDHIGGLPSLIESFRLGGRTEPLRIWALPEVLAVARALVEVFSFELTLDSWAFRVSFAAVQDGQSLTLAGMPARVVAMDHTVPCAGVRLELPSGAIAYTSDTQPAPAIRVLGEDARLLITECTYVSGFETAARAARHSTAREAGEQAAACRAGMLALVHVGLEAFVETARAEAGAAFGGTILIPDDGDDLTL